MELKNGNGLNSWFNAILWLNIAFSGLGLIMNLINLMKGDNVFRCKKYGVQRCMDKYWKNNSLHVFNVIEM